MGSIAELVFGCVTVVVGFVMNRLVAPAVRNAISGTGAPFDYALIAEYGGMGLIGIGGLVALHGLISLFLRARKKNKAGDAAQQSAQRSPRQEQPRRGQPHQGGGRQRPRQPQRGGKPPSQPGQPRDQQGSRRQPPQSGGGQGEQRPRHDYPSQQKINDQPPAQDRPPRQGRGQQPQRGQRTGADRSSERGFWQYYREDDREQR